MTKPTAKAASESVTHMTEYVLPQHANALGNIFGGQILAWVDLCAAICAQRHTGKMAITAGIDDCSFEQPIKVGQVVRLSARVTATFRSSLEILVHVEGENQTTGRTWTCVTAFVTFVAVDDELKPTSVRPLALEGEADAELARAAAERRAHRLSRRKQAKN